MIITLITFIFFPTIKKEEEIHPIYSYKENDDNMLYKYNLYFRGYGGYGFSYANQKTLILSLTVNTDEGIFSRYDFELLSDYLLKLRGIYSELKSILWFPEIFYITFLLKYSIGNGYIYAIFSILTLIIIFSLRLYSLSLLTHYYKKPIKIITYNNHQKDFIDLKIEKKLKKILMNVDKDGIKLSNLKTLKEFMPIIGN